MKRFLIAAFAVLLSAAPASAGNEFYAVLYNHSDAYVLMKSTASGGSTQTTCVHPSSSYSHRYTAQVKQIAVEVMHKECTAPVFHSAMYGVPNTPSFAVTVRGANGAYTTSGTGNTTIM